MKNAIELKNIFLRFNDREIIKKLSLNIATGSITGIMGLSGIGKTSLMRMINGSIKNEADAKFDGEILLCGHDVTDYEYIQSNRIIASVYQDPDTQIVFPDVLDEIAFGMENFCFSKDKMNENIIRFTKQLGIEHLIDRNPNNLSGGEKQLVVLAAILCIEPKILLLDECISQVDEDGKRAVKNMLQNLKNSDVTIIMVEHNYDNLDIADEIYELKDFKLNLVKKRSNI